MSAALPALLTVAVTLTQAPERLHVPGPGEWARAPTARHPDDGRSCTRLGQARTCTTYVRGRAVRVCQRRGGGRESCVRLASAAQALTTEGWATGPSPMGRLWIARGSTVAGRCSGTLTSADFVVTAAHCLWDGDGRVTGRAGGYISDTMAMTYVPGNAFAANGMAGGGGAAGSPPPARRGARPHAPARRGAEPHP